MALALLKYALSTGHLRIVWTTVQMPYVISTARIYRTKADRSSGSTEMPLDTSGLLRQQDTPAILPEREARVCLVCGHPLASASSSDAQRKSMTQQHVHQRCLACTPSDVASSRSTCNTGHVLLVRCALIVDPAAGASGWLNAR